MSYGMKYKELTFSDEEIAALFGHEAAEDEKPDRLMEYYFKGTIYEQICADLPLRIVVGHKGIGKSAVFQVMKKEFDDANILTIMLTPDDILELGEQETDMLKLIRIWKKELATIIANKVLDKFGDNVNPIKNLTSNIANAIISHLESSGFKIRDGMNKVLEYFTKKQKVVVFIDDLDRGWEGKKSDINRISAMLNAIRDISRDNPTINFKISLRTDAYYLYRTNDESTDKVEGSVVWMTWNNFEILALLAKRIVTYFGGNVSEQVLLKAQQEEIANTVLKYVFEGRFSGRGGWKDIPTYRLLMSLIRKRPRDLIKLCSLAAKEARRNSSNKIGTKEFDKIFETYSQGRLRDTINEFKSELKDIEKLLINMKPTKNEKTTKEAYQFCTDKLLSKVKNIMSMNNFYFSNGNRAEAKELCAFMYKINFLTARKRNDDGKIERKYFEENNFLANSFSDFGFDWEIHPAYRWALQPDNILSIMDTLVQYNDE